MDKTNKTLTIVIFILIGMLMITWMLFGNKIDEYKQLLEKTDTTTVVEKDTLYLDKIIRDTIPTVQYETIIKRDTVYQKQGDSVVVQPLLIKKKSIKTR